MTQRTLTRRSRRCRRSNAQPLVRPKWLSGSKTPSSQTRRLPMNAFDAAPPKPKSQRRRCSAAVASGSIRSGRARPTTNTAATSPAAWRFWWIEMKSAPVLGLPRCPRLPAVRHARRKPPVFMQNFFEQCQSAASISLDASTSLAGSVHVRDGGRGMAVRLAAFGTGALSASLGISLALLMTSGAAAQISASQPRPVTGFVSTFEIMRTVRSAGFDPLVPPLREGTTYVLRATDFRGILMRVVLDARTGAIRDVTRIVPATSVGMMPPLHGGPPAYSSAPYGSPSDFGAPTGMGPEGAPGQLSQ